MNTLQAFILGSLFHGIILAPFSYVWWMRRGAGRFWSVLCAVGTLLAPASIYFELTHSNNPTTMKGD